MHKYTIKDLKKALDYMENKIQTPSVLLEIDDSGRMKINAHDVSSNHVLITVYNSTEDGSLKMPDITETRRL